MKKEGKLKFIFAILVVVLICLISLGGIYFKDKNVRKNILPEYKLGMELDTDIIVKLDVDKKEETESDEENAENTEEVQQVENIDMDSYKKSKKIIEERLKISGVTQYTVRLDEKSGTMVFEIPEDLETSVLQNLFVKGKVEIIVSDTKEVIGDHNSFSNVTTQIQWINDAYYVRYDMEFTNEAKNKFKEVQNSIVNREDAEAANGEIAITIDGVEFYKASKTDFLNYAINGAIQLQSNQSSTKSLDLNETLKQFESVKNFMTLEPLPAEYTITYSSDVHSNINKYGIISVFAIIAVIMLVYLIIKNKLNGIYGWLNILGFISSLLLIVRFTKIQISIATMVSIAVMAVIQFVYTLKVLKSNLNSKMFTERTFEFTKILIPTFIVAVVIAFANILEISGFGMIIFWGMILFEIYNHIITRAIVTNLKNTK